MALRHWLIIHLKKKIMEKEKKANISNANLE